MNDFYTNYIYTVHDVLASSHNHNYLKILFFVQLINVIEFIYWIKIFQNLIN